MFVDKKAVGEVCVCVHGYVYMGKRVWKGGGGGGGGSNILLF